MYNVQTLCNKIDKIKLFANLGTRLFQETGGLSRWQELINNERKKKKEKTDKLFKRLPLAGQGTNALLGFDFLSAHYTEVAVAILLKIIFRVFSFSSES